MKIKTGDQNWSDIESFKHKYNGQWFDVNQIKIAGQWIPFLKEVMAYINEVELQTVDIYELLGRPTEPGHYTFINRSTIYGGINTPALRTGQFPDNTFLTIINEGYIRGSGGKGGYPETPQPGGTALLLDCPIILDNTNGYILGGGGGGGYGLAYVNGGVVYVGGGGGAGRIAGAGGAMYQNATAWNYTYPTAGTETTGGNRGIFYEGGMIGGNGGAPGKAGQTSTYPGGRGGYSIETKGQSLTIIGGGDDVHLIGIIK